MEYSVHFWASQYKEKIYILGWVQWKPR